MVPRVNEPENIKTPDYLFNNLKFDLKEIKGNSPYAIDNAIKNNKLQADNFIIDISITKIDTKLIISQIEKIYHSPKRIWINTIIIVKHNKLIKVFQRT